MTISDSRSKTKHQKKYQRVKNKSAADIHKQKAECTEPFINTRKNLFEEEENTPTSSPDGNYDGDHLNLRQIASSVRSLLNASSSRTFPRKKDGGHLLWEIFLRGPFDVVLIYLDRDRPLLSGRKWKMNCRTPRDSPREKWIMSTKWPRIHCRCMSFKGCRVKQLTIAY